MEKRHPKRRKDKMNPYTLSVEDGKYYVSFEDGIGVSHHMEIAWELYALMDSFELEDLAMINESERHLVQCEMPMWMIEQKRNLWMGITTDRVLRECGMEELIYRKMLSEQLHIALDKLSKVQRRRIILYYFYDLTYEKIAEIEGCSVHSVFVGLERAKEKIKKFLKLGVKNR